MSSSLESDPARVSLSSADRSAARPETASEELARLLDLAEGHRLRALPFDDLRRLARLYRGESARLARLRDRGGDLDQIGHLNSLCVRAHGLLYSAGGRGRPSRSLLRSFVSGLAGTGRFQAVAWAVMGIGGLIGYFLVALDPAALYALMPSSLGYDVSQIDALYRSAEARELFFAREATPISQNALFGSYLFANNTRVGIMAFATGALFGLPTLLLQLYNGIMIGTISAIFLRSEQAIDYLAWILPHGVPELTAITLCAAAGFVLGQAVAAPGRSTRSEALRRSGPKALALFLSSVPLFFAAAWIESFIRESALGTPIRFGITGAGVVVLVAFGLLVHSLDAEAHHEIEWLDDLIHAGEDAGEDQPAP